MGTLNQDIQTALLFMPEHRAKSKRSRALHLDTLLESFRRQSEVSAGALDLIFMAYRYSSAFDIAVDEFLGQKNKFSPATLKDLWQIVFAALLSRDKTPASALVDTGVDVARELFGERTTKITNAFLRRVGREKEQWQTRLEKEPALLLPTDLRKRWQGQPELLARAARQLIERPSPGFWAFDASGDFKKMSADDLGISKNSDAPELRFQAMDPGSWGFLKWAAEIALPKLKVPGAVYLDACAAPGGKLIGMRVLTEKNAAGVEFCATEPKFARLQMLQENLKRWGMNESVHVSDFAWGVGESPTPAEHLVDVALADLPCSGSGTFHTRPDLLSDRPFERLPELKRLQREILEDLKNHLKPQGLLLVSICSVDPEEVDNISEALAQKPDYVSWTATATESIEGITAWAVSL